MSTATARKTCTSMPSIDIILIRITACVACIGWLFVPAVSTSNGAADVTSTATTTEGMHTLVAIRLYFAIYSENCMPSVNVDELRSDRTTYAIHMRPGKRCGVFFTLGIIKFRADAVLR